jgi:hypothetical protein
MEEPKRYAHWQIYRGSRGKTTKVEPARGKRRKKVTASLKTGSRGNSKELLRNLKLKVACGSRPPAALKTD